MRRRAEKVPLRTHGQGHEGLGEGHQQVGHEVAGEDDLGVPPGTGQLPQDLGCPSGILWRHRSHLCPGGEAVPGEGRMGLGRGHGGRVDGTVLLHLQGDDERTREILHGKSAKNKSAVVDKSVNFVLEAAEQHLPIECLGLFLDDNKMPIRHYRKRSESQTRTKRDGGFLGKHKNARKIPRALANTTD